MARLDEFCEIEVESLWEPGASGWRVTVRLRNSPHAPEITVVRPRAVEAIREAIQDAEERGWSRAHPPSGRDAEGPLSYRPIQPGDLGV